MVREPSLNGIKMMIIISLFVRLENPIGCRLLVSLLV